MRKLTELHHIFSWSDSCLCSMFICVFAHKINESAAKMSIFVIVCVSTSCRFRAPQLLYTLHTHRGDATALSQPKKKKKTFNKCSSYKFQVDRELEQLKCF